MRITPIAAGLFASLSIAAAAQAPERRFAVAGFDAVELSSSDRVVVTAGAAPSVVATGDPVAVAAVRVEVRGGTLYVDRLPGTYRDHGAVVTVTVPRLAKVSVSGSGSIRAQGAAGPRFSANGSGSGDIVLNGLRAAETRLDQSGSGSITLAGSSRQLWINASGSGAVDTTRTATGDVDVTSSGSASIRARATRRAAIDASGSGSVTVLGTNDCRISNRGSGSVRCRSAS